MIFRRARPSLITLPKPFHGRHAARVFRGDVARGGIERGVAGVPLHHLPRRPGKKLEGKGVAIVTVRGLGYLLEPSEQPGPCRVTRYKD